MNTIHTRDQEQQLLIDLLEREILSLHKEIMHTDIYDYRQFLKDRERSLNDLLHNLQAQARSLSRSQSSVDPTAPPA
jgi:hypothetical protein